MALYTSNGKVKTFEQYVQDFSRQYVEIDDSIETIKSSDLIKMLQDLQIKNNTSDLLIRIVVTDSYYETANLLIERWETDAEFNVRVFTQYERDKEHHEKMIVENQKVKEKELAKLKKQQDEIQAKIDALQ